jgi:TrmH family RNA methyltransferase
MPRDDRRDHRPSRAITSLQNERVKLIRALDMRKVRRETGLFVAEGSALIATAREEGWMPRILVHGPGAGGNEMARNLIAWAATEGAECLDVSGLVLEKLAAKDNPQSLLAVFEQRFVPPPEAGRVMAESLWLALEEIRDPGNLGTIVRTADAAGAAGLILVGTTCDPYAREAVRASMGSIFAVPIARLGRDPFLRLARDWRGGVVGTHLTGTEDFRKARYQGPVLLVMGSEGSGLSAVAAKACRTLVKIPMAGRLDSLNLAVATALMLYEARRDRLKL